MTNYEEIKFPEYYNYIQFETNLEIYTDAGKYLVQMRIITI